METTGIIFDIKKYAIHDGPGIRTTVFLKGCPLDCLWCHNPESRLAEPQRVAGKTSVRRAGYYCLADENVVGKEMSVSEVIAEITKDAIFYQESGGGVTFSGGEPLHQPVFLEALLRACHAGGVTTAVDTSGYAPVEDFERIEPHTDLFLYDLKLVDDTAHEKYIGVSNRLILSNLQRLAAADRPIEIRVPLIPGITDTADNLEAIADLLKPMKNVRRITVLPYNKLGEDKLRRFGMTARLERLETQSPGFIAGCVETFESQGFLVSIGG